ncbi:MAG: hypothetical protein GWP06_13755 [Actinobacteria bacterium]|nr:hypothetical protein [Actinomycetota bacterium]
MDQLAEMLEEELEGAFELKDKKSLHRYVVLLAQNLVQKDAYDQNITELRSDIKIIAETMKQGFESVNKRFEDMYKYMDKRFEDMNNRFEDMNKRFNMMFTFMNIGFGIIILITILFKFLQ